MHLPCQAWGWLVDIDVRLTDEVPSVLDWAYKLGQIGISYNILYMGYYGGLQILWEAPPFLRNPKIKWP